MIIRKGIRFETLSKSKIYNHRHLYDHRADFDDIHRIFLFELRSHRRLFQKAHQNLRPLDLWRMHRLRVESLDEGI